MLSFYERKVDPQELLSSRGNLINYPWPEYWTRIEINIPAQFDATNNILDFIEDNINNGKYGYFIYRDRNKDNLFFKNLTNVMVIGFEIEEAATMFKLMGGHEAWEDN